MTVTATGDASPTEIHTLLDKHGGKRRSCRFPRLPVGVHPASFGGRTARPPVGSQNFSLAKANQRDLLCKKQTIEADKPVRLLSFFHHMTEEQNAATHCVKK